MKHWIEYQVSGKVYAVDEYTFLLSGFNYDGNGADTFFWSGASNRPGPQGFIVPDEYGKYVYSHCYWNLSFYITIRCIFCHSYCALLWACARFLIYFFLAEPIFWIVISIKILHWNCQTIRKLPNWNGWPFMIWAAKMILVIFIYRKILNRPDHNVVVVFQNVATALVVAQ